VLDAVRVNEIPFGKRVLTKGLGVPVPVCVLDAAPVRELEGGCLVPVGVWEFDLQIRQGP